MVDSNNAINDTVGATISGVTNTLTVTNPSNTASSAARETITVGGASSGDPTINWNVSGATDWEMGIDNTDSDKWKLSFGTALGTTDSIVGFTSGEVLKPRTPSFLADVSATVSNVTGDGTLYTIIFDSETQDIGSNYDVTTGLFTAPVDGIYLFTTAVNFTGVSAAHTGGSLTFFLNGATTYLQESGSPANLTDAAGNGSWQGSLVIPLSVGDTMGVALGVNAGAKTVDIFGTAAFAQPVTTFSGYLLG